MAKITVDFHSAVKPMKPLHGVGQPPFRGENFSLFHYLTEAGIPFSRLHDVAGRYGGGVYVDIPNIFRDFDADPSDPESYDFAFTDVLMENLAKAGVEPWYRLGVTIENYHTVRAYHIYPPKDNLKWARICEGIIRHYTEGWADGYHYNIRYWEIWNEPENGHTLETNMMWLGTKEEYFELYRTASCYLKERFPHLKIGGYASCGFSYIVDNGLYVRDRERYWIEFFEDFLDYVKEHNCPLDFFSWHSYDGDPENNRLYAEYLRAELDKRGFTGTESSLNEWNPNQHVDYATASQAAKAAANLILMQKGSVDTAMFYDGRWGMGVYAMFNPHTAEPFPVYYPFLYFNELYRLKTQTEACSDVKTLQVLAACDGERGAVLLANYAGEPETVRIEMPGWKIVSCLVVDALRTNEEFSFAGEVTGNCTMLLLTEKL